MGSHSQRTLVGRRCMSLTGSPHVNAPIRSVTCPSSVAMLAGKLHAAAWLHAQYAFAWSICLETTMAAKKKHRVSQKRRVRSLQQSPMQQNLALNYIGATILLVALSAGINSIINPTKALAVWQLLLPFLTGMSQLLMTIWHLRLSSASPPRRNRKLRPAPE